MQINLLKPGYKKDAEFYQTFLSGDLKKVGTEYIDESKTVSLYSMPTFPVYLGKGIASEKRGLFLELVHMLNQNFIELPRELLMNELFWHSYLCIYNRTFLLETYPQIRESQKQFEIIVTKDFMWENYIYKGVLAAQYVAEHVSQEDREEFYNVILDNFDLFNYIIKYEIFRNGQFLVNFLRIVSEKNLGRLMKATIKDRPELGSDERYGRRVIYEFNKSYPVVPAPMLTKAQLEPYVEQYLAYYYSNEPLDDSAKDDI